TFPFTLKHGTFRSSFIQFVYSTIFYSPLALIIWEIIFDQSLTNSVLLQSVIFTNIQLVILPASNLIWLCIKLNKMSSFVRSLIWIHKRIPIKVVLSLWFKTYFIILIFIDLLINITRFILVYEPNAYPTWKVLSVVTIRYFPVLAIVDQFSSVLDVIRMIFVEARNQLKVEKAEELIEVVELLRESCRVLNHCYAPQILMFLYTAVIYEVTIIYIFATSSLGPIIYYLSPVLSIAFFTSAILRLTTSCWRASLQMLSVITTCTLLMVQFGN
ncbi:Gustatory receptor 92b, partial [Halyomorpha halys]